MAWTRNQRIEWALDSFSSAYKIGWRVPKDGNYDNFDHLRSEALQRILGIPESKIGKYPFEQIFGTNDKGDGGWAWHPSLYWTGPNKVQNFLRYRRHKKALAAFRASHNKTATAISAKGIAFIADFEGYFANWYDDGFGNQTIGYGHTTESLHGLKPPLTRSEAAQLLNWDLDSYEAAVRQEAHRPLTQGQYDALTSIAFNVGIGILAEVMAPLNHGNALGTANLILQYDHANGQKVPGLTRRRKAERALFLS